MESFVAVATGTEPTTPAGRSCLRRDLQISVRIDADLNQALVAAARRRRIAPASLAWLAVVEAVENGVIPTARVPMRGTRGPYRPREKRLSYLINLRADREFLERLDAIARCGAATRSAVIEGALRAAVERISRTQAGEELHSERR